MSEFITVCELHMKDLLYNIQCIIVIGITDLLPLMACIHITLSHTRKDEKDT